MHRVTMRLIRGWYLMIVPLLAGGCSQVPALPAIPSLTPYKMDVQQGNVVTQEMVEKLRPGMSPSQVRFILGTPLVVDAFHKDRWDYVYRFSKAGTLQESRRIVIVFQDDKLARIEGDVVPAKPGDATDGGVTIAPGTGKPAGQKTTPATASPKPEGTKSGAEPSGTGPAGTASAPSGGEAAVKPNEAKAAEAKPQEERGFFGRMMDMLGF